MIECNIRLSAQSPAQMRKLLDRAAKSAKRGLMVTLHETSQGRCVGDAAIAFSKGGHSMYHEHKARARGERAKKKATTASPKPAPDIVPN